MQDIGGGVVGWGIISDRELHGEDQPERGASYTLLVRTMVTKLKILVFFSS